MFRTLVFAGDDKVYKCGSMLEVFVDAYKQQIERMDVRYVKQEDAI